jgi:hypothetical protein
MSHNREILSSISISFYYTHQMISNRALRELDFVFSLWLLVLCLGINLAYADVRLFVDYTPSGFWIGVEALDCTLDRCKDEGMVAACECLSEPGYGVAGAGCGV